MKQIESKITINASPEKIWQTLLDFEAYGEWNPFIASITGEAEKGKLLDVNIIQEKDKLMNFKPVVLTASVGRELRWRGKLFIDGLFDGEHYFMLRPKGDSTTEFIHGEKFTGLLSSVLFKMIGEKTRNGFIAMNNALKDRAENHQS